MIRMLGLMIVSILVTVILIELINMNIVINELNNISSLAVGQTQKYIKDFKIYDLENNKESINDEDYRNYFIKRFNEGVIDKSIYDLSGVEADYKHGLLYVSIKCKKYPKIKTKKLINIIEIDGEYGKGDRYKKGYSIWSSQRSYKKNEKVIYSTKLPNLQSEKSEEVYKIEHKKITVILNEDLTRYISNDSYKKPTEIFSIDDGRVTLLNYKINVKSFIITQSTNVNAYWYPGLELYYFKDGEKHIIDSKAEAKSSQNRVLTGDEKIELDNLHLDITAYNPKNGYESKINAMLFENSSITYEYFIEWRGPYDASEISEDIENKIYSYEMVYPRYIDREFYETLSKDSIWRKGEYKEILNNYFDKYEKSF